MDKCVTRTISPKQAAIIANRRVLRRAFDIIRADKQQRKLIDQLAGCLGASISQNSRAYADGCRQAREICILNGHSDLVAAADAAKIIARKRARLSIIKKYQRAVGSSSAA